MFTLFRRSRKTTPTQAGGPRFARPRLESLESRWVPSTVTLNPVQYGTSRNVTISGTLSDMPDPAFRTINLTGQVSTSAMTNSQGQFSVTAMATALGDVNVAAADGQSNTATATLTDGTISIAFHVQENPNRVWTLYGDVTYSRGAQQLTVYFGGYGGEPVSLTNLTTMTNSSGHYEFSITLNGTYTDNGMAWAKASTPWGTLSLADDEYIYQTGT